jgi:hypothetical protein
MALNKCITYNFLTYVNGCVRKLSFSPDATKELKLTDFTYARTRSL